MKREIKAAWKDEEDEETLIDISKVSRLRKLIKSSEETEITGTEYQSRLRDVQSKLQKGKYDWASK